MRRREVGRPEVDAAALARGVAYLRAPVSGNASIVHTGALSCFVSGPKDAFERVKPLFASFTRAQTYLGPGEEARYAKLAVNLMIAVSAAMMAASRSSSSMSVRPSEQSR